MQWVTPANASSSSVMKDGDSLKTRMRSDIFIYGGADHRGGSDVGVDPTSMIRVQCQLASREAKEASANGMKTHLEVLRFFFGYLIARHYSNKLVEGIYASCDLSTNHHPG